MQNTLVNGTDEIVSILLHEVLRFFLVFFWYCQYRIVELECNDAAKPLKFYQNSVVLKLNQWWLHKLGKSKECVIYVQGHSW